MKHEEGKRVVKDEVTEASGVVFGLPRELPSLFAGEHTAGESNLPVTVSQSTILAENEQRDPMPWGATREDE